MTDEEHKGTLPGDVPGEVQGGVVPLYLKLLVLLPRIGILK